MLVKFNMPRTRVMFINESGTEYKNMMKFPAFLKEGPYFYVPAKSHVVYNVINRLKSAFKRLVIDKEVHEFMNSPMKLKKLPEDFKYLTPPLDFQDIALRYAYTVGSCGWLLDPGMGKSKVALDYIALMKFKRSMIVCPRPLLFVWEDEVAKHRNDLTIHVVETTNWEEEWDKGKDKNIFCLNYSKLSIFLNELKKIPFEFIHLDEFLIKDPSTIRTQSVFNVSENIPYRAGGSGTLINNSILDVYSPVRYLEPSLVGSSFVDFRNRHVYRNPRDLKMVVGYRRGDEAKSILESCCIVMSKEEWLKLPPKNIVDVIVDPSEEQTNLYKSLAKNYIAKIDEDYIEVDNALVMMCKLYQIANGFVYISEKKEDKNEQEILDLLAEDAPKKKKVPRRTKFLQSQPKITALMNLLNNQCKNKRGIIWFNMEPEYQLITKAMTETGISFLSIKGGDKKIGQKVREFNNNANIGWLICQAKSVNYGITVLGTSLDKLENSDFEALPEFNLEVHTEIFYSCNFSLEVYLQQQDRIHRIGQKYNCDYYRIWNHLPVEYVIRDALSNKMSIRKEMLVDIAEKLKELD